MKKYAESGWLVATLHKIRPPMMMKADDVGENVDQRRPDSADWHSRGS
jgi:hypothetical protein